MVKLTFELSEEACEFLKYINEEGYVEYRDCEYESKEEFMKSDLFKNNTRTLEWFMIRNANGTYHLIEELLKYNLVDSDDAAYHTAFVLTDFGKEILKQLK